MIGTMSWSKGVSTDNTYINEVFISNTSWEENFYKDFYQINSASQKKGFFFLI